MDGVGWDWVREPKGRTSGEFNDLINTLQNAHFSFSCRDTWKWELDSNGVFVVKTLAKLVDEKSLKTGVGIRELRGAIHYLKK